MKKLLLISILFFATSVSAIETGEKAADFSLKSITGESVSLKDYAGKVVVLEWFNPGCPFVQKHYKEGDMPELQSKSKEKGVIWLTINSTNAEHRDYQTPEMASAQKAEWKIESSKILLDPSGAVGKKYSAKTTPHMFVIDTAGKIVYQGAIDSDSSVFTPPKSAKNYVKEAIDAVLAGQKVGVEKTDAYGCSIKYAD